MKINKSESGFTLIEILVAINLAFMTITLIISFYLMFNKLLLSTIRKLESNTTLQISLYNFNELLNKSDSFSVYPKNDSTFIIFGDINYVTLSKDKISIKNIYQIKDFDGYTLEITSYDGKKDALIENGKLKPGYFYNDTCTVINSSEINSLKLLIDKNKQFYGFQYFTPNVSGKRFTNLYK